ncbi:MAG: response regulator [Anaerolineae bacterium]|nr:response regulator [Anaerolineae bacterium]
MPEARLLIIEDDVELAEMLSVFFQAQGYEVFQAWDGREGVSLARQKLPNLVLLDVNLPDMDGFDVCRALRTTNRTRYIPITFPPRRTAAAIRSPALSWARTTTSPSRLTSRSCACAWAGRSSAPRARR